jgi:two-component system cell cycle sensor histidine kinase/response regulator CckA
MAAHRGEIGLVVLDVIMPQMGGQECLRQLRKMNPELKVLISTGYTARGLAEELVAEGVLGIVEKPFRIWDFTSAVRAALDRP